MQSLWNDVRYALRTLKKSPAFAVAALLVLSLGIGATTAIFSVVHAVLLRPLPFNNPSQLVAFSALDHSDGKARIWSTVSLNHVELWRHESRTLASIGSFVFTEMPLRVGDQSFSFVGIGADPELLRTLGTNLAMGRNFSGSGSSRTDPSVIVSHRIWVEALGSDPSAVGRTVLVNGDPLSVIGVLPAGFQFPRTEVSYSAQDPEFLIPIANIADAWGRNSDQWFAIGRLESGVTAAQATAEINGIMSHSPGRSARDAELSIRITPLDAEETRAVRTPLWLMMGVSIVLLLIACTNIMNLLFSRAAARGREMAIRKAAGATTARLIRQLLTESACLVLFAGILGTVLAAWVTDGLVRLSPAHLPISGAIGIDPAVLGFTFLVCGAVVIVAGLIPALRATCGGENLVHSAGSRVSGDRFLAQSQRALTVAQMALGLGLLTAAGLLVHSLWRLNSVDPGFRTEGVFGFGLTMPVGLTTADKSDLDHIRRTYLQTLDQIRSIPGVVSAGWITLLPPETRGGLYMPLSVAGQPNAANDRSQSFTNFQITSEDYFKTVGMLLDRGRDFTAADAMEAPPVAIVNEAFARHFFPGVKALGQRIFPAFDGGTSPPREIVGILKDAHDRGLARNTIPTAYVPLRQFALAYGSIAVRAAVGSQALIPEIRGRIAKVNANVALSQFQTLDARLHETMDEPRFYTLMAGACGLMAVLFVTLGLYGVVAYSVSRRTPEIGIRMALGAHPQDILTMVLRQGMEIAVFGVALGIALSLATTRILSSLLFEVQPRDPATFAIATAVVVIVTLAASYIPARRASRVDPMVALRYE